VNPVPLRQRLLSEFIGTALLLCAVIGSGIMGERLAAGNTAVALLANTLATVFALFVLIETFGPLSGAHFNPLVTLAFGRHNGLTWPTMGLYIAAQLAGALAGAALANTMFDLPALHESGKVRAGPGQWLGEVLATAGLLLVIGRAAPGRASALVAAYIGAAYWFTSSTSFANPAAAFGRMFSDTFAGISPASVTGFVLAQTVGAALAVMLLRWLAMAPKQDAA
jgi:glycerol uptake facilitator-like aquaporin